MTGWPCNLVSQTPLCYESIRQSNVNQRRVSIAFDELISVVHHLRPKKSWQRSFADSCVSTWRHTGTSSGWLGLVGSKQFHQRGQCGHWRHSFAPIELTWGNPFPYISHLKIWCYLYIAILPNKNLQGLPQVTPNLQVFNIKRCGWSIQGNRDI